MGIFQQSPFKTLVLQAFLGADDAGQEAHHRVDQRDRRRLAPGEHDIAEADFLDAVELHDPLVDAFETAAEQGQRAPGGIAAHHRLVQPAAARGQEHHRFRPPMRRADGLIDDLRLHHHAGAAAKGGVVHGAVFIACETANVHCFQAPDSRFQRLAGQGMAQRTGEHLRKDAEHGDAPKGHFEPGGRNLAHACSFSAAASAASAARSAGPSSSSPSGGSTTIRPAARSTTGTTRSVKGRLTEPFPGLSMVSRSPAPKFSTARTTPKAVPSVSTTERPTRSAW